MSQMTPEHFFNKVAPQQIKAMSVPKSQRHTFVFRLFGDNAGVWTIDLNRKKVTRGGVDKPDLYLEMNHSDFTGLLSETLDVPTACMQGRIRFAGNIELLAQLGQLMVDTKTKSN